MEKSIILMGSGIGSLYTGVVLSKKGYKVSILEAHNKLGGYASTFRRKVNEELINFDSSLHGIGNLNQDRDLYKKLVDQNIINNEMLSKKNEVATLIFRGEEIKIPQGIENVEKQMKELFPNQIDGIDKFLSFLKNFDNDMEKNVFAKGNIPTYFDTLENISLSDFVYKYVQDEDFLHYFSVLWLYFGLPPQEINALYYVFGWTSYVFGGTYYINGGGYQLITRMEELIKNNGGEIYKSHPIDKINIKNNKIESVIARNKEFRADEYICSFSPLLLEKLIDDNQLIKQELKIFKDNECDFSLSQLFIVLDKEPQSLGISDEDYFIDSGNNDFNYHDILCANYKNTPLGIVNYHKMDKKIKQNIIVLTIGDLLKHYHPNQKELYLEEKQNLETILLDRLYELFPLVKDHIIFTNLATPYTMKRYTSNPNGAVYGLNQTIKCGGNNRPTYVSKNIDNLTYVSSWVNPGGGFEGSLRCGIFASKYLLDKLKGNTKIKSKVSPDILVYETNKYLLDSEYKYQLELGDKSYILGNNKKEQTDLIIKTDKDSWYQLGSYYISGESATSADKLKLIGDVNAFNYLLDAITNEDVVHPKYNFWFSIIMSFLSFVPIILMQVGMIYTNLTIVFLSLSAISWVIINCFKHKYITSFDKSLAIGIITSIVLYILKINNVLFIGIITTLAILLLLKPNFLAKIIKPTLPSNFTSTQSFNQISLELSIMWIIIILIQTIIIYYSHNSISNLVFILSLIGMIISYLYPLKKRKEI